MSSQRVRTRLTQPAEYRRQQHVADEKRGRQRTELESQIRIARREDAGVERQFRQHGGKDLPVDVVEQVDAEQQPKGDLRAPGSEQLFGSDSLINS